MKVLIVTGANEAHADLLKDFITSLRMHYGHNYEVALLDFASKPFQDDVLSQFDLVQQFSDEAISFQKKRGYFLAYTAAKARLTEIFPGYDVYCWVDADCWFNSPESVPRMVRNALKTEITIHPEYDIHYWGYPTPSDRTLNLYKSIYGENHSTYPIKLPMINAGVFAMSKSSKVWKLWASELLKMRERSLSEDIYFSDQIPLHRILYSQKIKAIPLRAVDNWQVNACPPKIFYDGNKKTIWVAAPTEPFEKIGIIHLAGRTKDHVYDVDGFKTTLRFSALQFFSNTLSNSKSDK